MIDGLYQRLVERARGICECGCLRPIPPGSADHFFGRAKSEESEATVWLLHTTCDYQKTRNHPTVSVWLERFIKHAQGHGYRESVIRAQARLFFADTRRAFARGALR